MIEKRIVELMNGEIDGANSREESLELKRYLDTHPEAKRYYEDLKTVTHMFDQAEELTPPPDLRETILTSIFEREGGEERRNVFTSILAGLRATFSRRYAYSFTVGIIAGILLFALFSWIVPWRQPAEDLDNLLGTITTGNLREVTTVGPIDFHFPSVTGSARVRYTEDRILAAIQLSAKSEIQVLFHHDENVRFEGLRSLKSCNHEMRVTGEETELSHIGICEYIIVFEDVHRSHPQIGFKIFADGNLLFERSIVPGQE